MTAFCDQVHAFADGELGASEAERFRDHLSTCETCARELHDLMMLEALDAPPPEPRRSNVRSLDLARRKRRRALGFLGMALPLAVAAGWAVRVELASHRPEPLASLDATSLEVTATRSLEARLSYAAADRHRSYDVTRGAEVRSREPVPLATLAALEAKGDTHGVGAGLALSGDLDRAAQVLERAGESLDVAADRAAVMLARGDAGKALAELDAVLQKKPAHPQALFNRAIALRELGLVRAAAEGFERAAALNEPGWSDEARARAAALRAREDARAKALRDAKDAGLGMVGGGPVPGDEIVRAVPDLTRHYFNHALRAAGSRDRVGELAPLARALDARAGGHVLSDAIERAAARDFTRRAPLAARYARLVTSDDALDPAAAAAYLAALRAAGETDMLLGAVPLVDALASDADEYERLAKTSGDPWFIAIAARARAEEQVARADFARAEETLRRGMAECATRVDYPCAFLAYQLSGLLERAGRTSDARVVALAGLAATRATPSLLEPNLVYRLGDIARMEDDVPLLRAYLRDVELASPGDCTMTRTIHTDIASADILALDADGAVAELARVPRCGAPISLLAADVTVDAVRMGRAPSGADSLLADFVAARETLAPGDRALADVIEARLRILRDPAAGEALARRALGDASHLAASDTTAAKAEVYARLTLAIEAARVGRAEQALAEIASGVRAGAAAARRDACALAVAMDDDRALAVTRDAAGAAVAELTVRTSPEPAPAAIVPPVVRARLAGCESVRVFALPPLHGIPALLPPEVAWGYVSSDLAASQGAPPPRRVVVSDVNPPASLGLPPLAGWTAPSADARWLHGDAATPSRVLAEIADATEIELHVHGFVDAAQSAASLLAFSPDPGGRFSLTAADLERKRLRGSPVVVLGACHAAHTARSFHEAWNLPTAFIRAGARSVLASPSVIRDAEAAPFFDAVLARVRAGTPPAVALRDERVAWLARDPSSWVKDVIDFE